MDEPIIYCPSIPPSSPDEPPEDLYDKLEFALTTDNKDEFLRLINEPDFCYDLDDILEYHCPKIATALIDGEAASIFNDNRLNFEEGWTPMHLVCFGPSPWLIEVLSGKGYSVDAHGDYAPLHLKHATPLDLALEIIDTGYLYGYGTINLPWTPNFSIIDLLHYVCHWQKPLMEVIRLLVQKTKNKQVVRKAFFKYGEEKKPIKLTALFLAAPELFLPISSESDNVIEELYLNLNSLAKNDIVVGILLLLDVFSLVGHKLIAYIRVDDSENFQHNLCYGQYNIAFFLREDALEADFKKLGFSSLDDYLLRLFKPVSQEVYKHHSYYWGQNSDRCSYVWKISTMPIKIEDMDIDYVKRVISRLKPHDAGLLKEAINNKLSVMEPIRDVFEEMRKQRRVLNGIVKCELS